MGFGSGVLIDKTYNYHLSDYITTDHIHRKFKVTYIF